MTLLGLDIGGTTLKAIAFNMHGKILKEETAPTQDDGSRKWLNNVRELYQKAADDFHSSMRVGIAAPGLPSRDGKSICSMPGRLAGLEGLEWEKFLDAPGPVPVLNDARAALLGENWLGAAKGYSNVILLTLGTGVGGAVMVDGRILHGHLGRAGHLGHVSLDASGQKDIVNTPGSLEDAIGDHTLARRSSGKFHSTFELLTAFRTGDDDARKVWTESVRALGAALSGFINLFDPELILLGGGIAEAGPDLFGPLNTVLDEFEWRPFGSKVRLFKAALGPRAGAAGAAFAAKQAYG
jgi:glucokinase